MAALAINSPNTPRKRPDMMCRAAQYQPFLSADRDRTVAEASERRKSAERTARAQVQRSAVEHPGHPAAWWEMRHYSEYLP
jgi:hypothetical protein